LASTQIVTFPHFFVCKFCASQFVVFFSTFSDLV
jgi:hypothetical protein